MKSPKKIFQIISAVASISVIVSAVTVITTAKQSKTSFTQPSSVSTDEENASSEVNDDFEASDNETSNSNVDNPEQSTQNQSSEDSNKSNSTQEKNSSNSKSDSSHNSSSNSNSNSNSNSSSNSNSQKPDNAENQKPTTNTIAPTNLSLNKTSISLNTGESATVAATISPSNASNKTVTWTSSNSSVATVSNGKVAAKGPGKAVITAKTSNNISKTCTITVTQPVTNISLNGSNQSYIFNRAGQTATVTYTATISPSNASNKTVTWTSSNSSVATVSNGKVIAKGIGTATITAKSNNGKTATRTITVRKQKIILIGNSKTYRYGKPSIKYEIQNILSNLGYDVSLTTVAPGGTTLAYKLNSSCTNHEKLSGKCADLVQQSYDIAILQEQTATAAAKTPTTYRNGATAIAKALRSKNSGIRIYLRQSWSTYEQLATGEHDQAYMNTNSSDIASSINATVVPDGRAFYKNKTKALYNTSDNNDTNHASHKGAYLAALCIVAKVYNVNTTSVSYTPKSGVTAAEAKTYRSYANSECR